MWNTNKPGRKPDPMAIVQITRKNLSDTYQIMKNGGNQTKVIEFLNTNIYQWRLVRARFVKYWEIQKKKDINILNLTNEDRELIEPKKRVGAPYKINFDELNLPLIQDMLAAGYTQQRIYNVLGINQSTWQKLKFRHPKLKEIIKNGKTLASLEVLKALHLRAVGMSIPATHFASFEGKIFTKEYQKIIPPETKACISWLINSELNWKTMNVEGAGNVDDNETEFDIHEQSAYDFEQNEGK